MHSEAHHSSNRHLMLTAAVLLATLGSALAFQLGVPAARLQKARFSLQAATGAEAPGLSEASRGMNGEVIRDYQPLPGVPWRYGSAPDYTVVNKAYFEGAYCMEATTEAF